MNGDAERETVLVLREDRVMELSGKVGIVTGGASGKRDLDRMGRDIEAFRTSLDACDIAPADRAPRTRR